jgi:hypothetical protein
VGSQNRARGFNNTVETHVSQLKGPPLLMDEVHRRVLDKYLNYIRVYNQGAPSSQSGPHGQEQPWIVVRGKRSRRDAGPPYNSPQIKRNPNADPNAHRPKSLDFRPATHPERSGTVVYMAYAPTAAPGASQSGVR